MWKPGYSKHFHPLLPLLNLLHFRKVQPAVKDYDDIAICERKSNVTNKLIWSEQIHDMIISNTFDTSIKATSALYSKRVHVF